jgi:hypothetical protein
MRVMARATYKDISKMGVPIPGQPLKIRYKGVWDMQDLYGGTVSWLRERKWKFHERVYKHKHPSPYGVERQYIWRAEQRIDDWVMIVMDIYIHVYDAHDVEVVDKEGTRRVFTKGKFWATLKVNDCWDPVKRWDTSSFWGYLKDFYIKYIVKKRRMQGYSPRSRYELLSLHKFMMKKLKMETKDFEYANIAGVHRRGPL